MPKRKLRENVDRYEKVLKKLKLQADRRRVRVIDSDSSDSDEKDITENDLNHTEPVQDSVQDPESEIPELDTEVLTALGDSTEDTPKFGTEIHQKLAKLWIPILKKGLDKEARDKLLKQHIAPNNCTLIQAPKLNSEISAAVSDTMLSRDKRVECTQNQIGACITALNRGLEILMNDDSDKLKSIKYLSDSCRLLCDVHFGETQIRRKFVAPNLDKSFLNIVQDIERDDLLYGTKLSEKIKASKVIEKQGLQIKKVTYTAKNSTSVAQTSNTQSRSSYSRAQGNWTGPPRYQSSSRGGRGGQKKAAPAGRTPVAPAPQPKSTSQNKKRVSAQRY